MRCKLVVEGKPIEQVIEFKYLRIYKSSLRSISSYATEKGQIPAGLQNGEHGGDEKIKNYSRQDTVRKGDLKKQINVKNITKLIRKTRKFWNKHVERIDDTTLAKRQKHLNQLVFHTYFYKSHKSFGVCYMVNYLLLHVLSELVYYNFIMFPNRNFNFQI